MSKLHRESPIPLNYQLTRQFETEIIEGRWKVGQKIPSVRQLTELYDVSVPSVRKALGHLVSEGVIETIPASGSYVRKRPSYRKAESTHTLVFMLTNASQLKMSYYMRTLPEVAKEASKVGLGVEFNHLNSDINNTLRTSQPSGVIWCGGGEMDYIRDLIERQVPVVAIGDGPDIEGVTRIVNDDFDGGCLAGRHLLGLGHRKLLVFQRDSSLPYVRRRLAGFRYITEDYADAQLQTVACNDEDADIVARRILQADELPTAIFATSDRLAHTLMRQAALMGVDVPGQISVMGFGDEPFAEFMTPALTSICINHQQLGQACVDVLWNGQSQAKGDWIREIKLNVQLVERSTTASRYGSE